MVQPKRTLADLGISRETLELTPGRSMQLLSAIATVAAIRAPLQKRGYTNAVHQRGWDLLEAVIRPLGNLPPSDTEVNDAIATLDAWDQEGLELVRVSLTQFPEVRSFLLEGLEPAEGLAAVLVVKELLARFERWWTGSSWAVSSRPTGHRRVRGQPRWRGEGGSQGRIGRRFRGPSLPSPNRKLRNEDSRRRLVGNNQQEFRRLASSGLPVSK